jgi:hypothetical protein
VNVDYKSCGNYLQYSGNRQVDIRNEFTQHGMHEKLIKGRAEINIGVGVRAAMHNSEELS